MSRPTARILNHTAIGRTHWDFTVKQADGFWCILYKGEPFNLVKTNRYRPDISAKYQRTAWANPQAAQRLCARLNKYFGCEDFTVVCLR
jgi:hypothetical protein